MNATTLKLSAALTLALGVSFAAMSFTGAKPAPAPTQVIELGTIHVTRADAEGVKRAAPERRYGSTAYLGRIQVTPADSADARSAALAARNAGAVFLGSITVTANDSEDARYAETRAAEEGGVYLGSIRVTPTGRSAVGRGLVAVERYIGTHAALAAVGTLVFGRVGG